MTGKKLQRLFEKAIGAPSLRSLRSFSQRLIKQVRDLSYSITKTPKISFNFFNIHQFKTSVTSWLLAQYRITDAIDISHTLVESSTDLVYPMPTWAQKSAVSCTFVDPPTSSSDSYDEGLAQKTLDIVSATLALLVVSVFGFALILHRLSTHPSSQAMGANVKWTTTSTPMSSQQQAL